MTSYRGFRVHTVPRAIFILMFERSRFNVLKFVDFRGSIDHHFHVNIHHTTRPSVHFQHVFFHHSANGDFPYQRASRTCVYANLLLGRVHRFFHHIFVRERVRRRLLTFRVLATHFHATYDHLIATTTTNDGRHRSNRNTYDGDLPFRRGRLLSGLGCICLPGRF